MVNEYKFNFPIGLLKCHIWQKLFLSEDDIGELNTVMVLVDESHDRSEIRKCRRCGQMFFYNFVEEIDWKEGEDRQYRTLLPIGEASEADSLVKKSFARLRQISPRIEWDFLDEKKDPVWDRFEGED